MQVEERVQASLEAERVAVRRSLERTARELVAQREPLQRAVERWKSQSADGDLVDVADAMMAYEALRVRARWLQDRLRGLSSCAEYERRVRQAREARG